MELACWKICNAFSAGRFFVGKIDLVEYSKNTVKTQKKRSAQRKNRVKRKLSFALFKQSPRAVETVTTISWFCIPILLFTVRNGRKEGPTRTFLSFCPVEDTMLPFFGSDQAFQFFSIK